jgi:hypothetical protein
VFVVTKFVDCLYFADETNTEAKNSELEMEEPPCLEGTQGGNQLYLK